MKKIIFLLLPVLFLTVFIYYIALKELNKKINSMSNYCNSINNYDGISVVKFKDCGLGNQMFIYAFGKILEKNTKTKVFFEKDELDNSKTNRKFCLDKMNTKMDIISKSAVQNLNLKTIDFVGTKEARSVDLSIIKSTGNYIYYGHWENPNWGYTQILKELYEDFSVKEDLDKKNSDMLKKIQKTNSVALNFRVNNPKTDDSSFISLGKKYYKNAMDYISSKVKNPHYYIFSERQDLCKEILDLKETKHTFVNINDDSKNYLDMNLMKNCKHNITSYSTFSWWGAFLNKNANKIVTLPKGEWYKNINLTGKNLFFKGCKFISIN
ncbi:MAG: alpha-1,2-fucosyltransferase [Oscillospiraceae bacterium]|jgi:hypothetical protein|nr:alpha-1,2-fucosyltransferase [Oscillospiraceae bacterium]